MYVYIILYIVAMYHIIIIARAGGRGTSRSLADAYVGNIIIILMRNAMCTSTVYIMYSPWRVFGVVVDAKKYVH